MTGSDSLPPLREVIRRLGLSARKSLGQNFILDLNLTRRIARAAPSLDDCVILEIGPGPGGLTRALLMEGARKVIAVERDGRFLPALQEISSAYPGRLDYHHADALSFDYSTLDFECCRIVANLPYGIATPLLVSWLSEPQWPPWYASLTLMFQKEVGDRIVAAPGSKSYGRLSVLSQWRARTKRLFTLPPAAFTPPPKVESAVVELLPHSEPATACGLATLEKITAAAFGQRRKMLRSSLRGITGDPEALLSNAGIRPDLRAENLSVEDYCILATALEQHGRQVIE